MIKLHHQFRCHAAWSCWMPLYDTKRCFYFFLSIHLRFNNRNSSLYNAVQLNGIMSCVLQNYEIGISTSLSPNWRQWPSCIRLQLFLIDLHFSHHLRPNGNSLFTPSVSVCSLLLIHYKTLQYPYMELSHLYDAYLVATINKELFL